MRRNIPAATAFLSLREQELARYLFGSSPQLHFFGGYADAERKTLCFLPDYLEEAFLYGEESPIVCLRARFFEGDAPSHRDFLGALMGCGVERDVVGDILVGSGSCDFFVTAGIAPHIEQTLLCVGRTRVSVQPIALSEVQCPATEFVEVRDTVASPRLDSIVSVGFRIGRSLAGQYIGAGKAAVDGLPCEKADKLLAPGMCVSVRGLGKIRLHDVGGRTKKDRIWVVIHRYV